MKTTMSRQRLWGAMAGYGVLAAAALALLQGPFLTFVMVFLGILVAKTWVAYWKDHLG